MRMRNRRNEDDGILCKYRFMLDDERGLYSKMESTKLQRKLPT